MDNSASAQVHQNKKRRSTIPDLTPDTLSVLQPLILSQDDYVKIMNQMITEFHKGLERDTHDTATIQMFNSYVRAIPDGTERGTYVTLDLGGTNFRILLATLGDDNKLEVENSTYVLPMKIMQGTGEGLFNYLADCIHKTVNAKGLAGETLNMGFTFSFPCYFRDLNKAVLAKWTKHFECSGVVGQEVVALLQQALIRRGDLDVKCLAVINDTVGTLMSCAREHNNCAIGLILGTGTNAAYIEQIENVELWDGDDKEPREVIIDTEWEYFGDDGALDFIRTNLDRKVDDASSKPKVAIYEKMISGMYLGEVARLYMQELVQRKLLFDGNGSSELKTEWRFYTKYISEIEADDDSPYHNTRLVLEDLGVEDVTEDDIHIVKQVCAVVSKRAAYLAASGIAALLNKMNRPDVTVGIDGSLFQFHPKFKSLMMHKLSQLVRPGIKYQLVQCEDGSGIGAALVAAVAHRINLQSNGH